jgi:hypothetical protein
MSDYRVRKFEYADEADEFPRLIWVRWGRTAEDADRLVRQETETDPEWTVQVDAFRGPYWTHRVGLAEFDLRVFGPVLG